MAEGTNSTAHSGREAQTVRVRNIIAVVESLRELHEELNAPIRWGSLQRVFAREEITVVRTAMRRRADVFCSLGVSVISINSSVPKRGWAKLASHEYGHIKLHLSEHFEGHEVVRNLSPCRKGDRREYEAELFAMMLLRGPGVALHDAELLRLVRKIEAAHTEQLRMPLLAVEKRSQLQAEDRHKIDPDDHLTWMLKRLRRDARQRPKLSGSTGDPLPVSEDTERLEFRGGNPPVIYTDPEGRRWQLYDCVFFGRYPQGKRRQVPIGAEYAKARYFINALGQRKVYVFTAGELRDVKVKHLDRQIQEARDAGKVRSQRTG